MNCDIIIISLLQYYSQMSEFAFFRFKSANMLTDEEERNRDEIVRLTEDVLDAKGIECDAKIAKISEDQLREILAEVRRLRRKKKKTYVDSTDIDLNEQSEDIENSGEKVLTQVDVLKMDMDNLTNRWLATLGIGVLIFGLALFVLKVPVRTMLIFFAIGIPVVFLWLYADEKSRREKKEMENLIYNLM